jgi:flagellar motor switch protein FliG
LQAREQAQEDNQGRRRGAAEILNYLGGTVEASITAHIRETDADLAQQIQDKMFVFDNLIDLDDRSIQLLMREVQSETLIVALKGTSERTAREDLQEHVPARCRDAARRPRVEGPGTAVRGGGRAARDPEVSSAASPTKARS